MSITRRSLSQLIRIGTRSSTLALYQARVVAHHLETVGHATQLIPIESEGEADQKTPLYGMGIQGIFTRTLDAALLNDAIDIAVHSLKDVPTQLPTGVSLAAVTRREFVRDVLICREMCDPDSKTLVVGTSSLRRRAQWLNRYPDHTIVDLRGNIQTRLNKLEANGDMNAIIMAGAALTRLQLRPSYMHTLTWMIPAPAQGALGITCRTDDNRQAVYRHVNDSVTENCVTAERDFLRVLHGGCTMPIGALATQQEDTLRFQGQVLTVDGSKQVQVGLDFAISDVGEAGRIAAEALLESGGREIVESYRSISREGK